MQTEYDIIIVGGGMVGATLALGLRAVLPETVSMAVIEAVEPVLDSAFDNAAAQSIQTSYDGRSSALAAGSQEIYESLGLWQEISRAVEPILNIHVSDRGHFGMVRLSAAEHGVPALGYVVDNHWLGQVLVRRLRATANIDWLCPMQVRQLQPLPKQDQQQQQQGWELVVGKHTVNARLVVLADGGRSPLADMLGIESDVTDYGQKAIVANVTTAKPHHNTAYERFTDEGPMALLPRANGDCALIWIMPAALADERLELVEEDFLRELQERFGYRLGRFRKVGTPLCYPLSLRRAREQVRSGLVVLGNAAHSLHPVAGQGLNLSLRDTVALIETIRMAVEADQDFASLAVLQSYIASRESDQYQTVGFSDKVVRLFSNNSMVLAASRNLGLAALDFLFPLKDLFARQAMGLGVRQVMQEVKQL